MGTLLDQIQLTQQTKENIKSAIREKDIEVLDTDKFSEYPDKIRAIGNDDEWKPNPEWYDIEQIVRNDEDTESGKIILLLNDTNDTIKIAQIDFGKYSKIKTSDGVEYNFTTKDIIHTWNKEFDKPCNEGYNTRYIIFYYNEEVSYFKPNVNYWNEDILYFITINITINKGLNTSAFWNTCHRCECIKIINTNYLSTTLFFSGMMNLQKVIIENSNFPNLTRLDCKGTHTIKDNDFEKFLPWENINNINSFHANNYFLKKYTYLANNTQTQLISIFSRCYNLEEIKNPISLKNCTSAYDAFSYCRKLKNNPIADGDGENLLKCQNMYLENYELKYLDLNVSNSTDIGALVRDCYKLKTLKLHNTSKANSFYFMCANCFSLITIDALDFDNATNILGIFNGCYSLQNIDEVRNIKITGLTFSNSSLNHETLLRILNALYDYSIQELEEPHQLTLGNINLNKLTDEEKAIATEKGWTLS